MCASTHVLKRVYTESCVRPGLYVIYLTAEPMTAAVPHLEVLRALCKFMASLLPLQGQNLVPSF